MQSFHKLSAIRHVRMCVFVRVVAGGYGLRELFFGGHVDFSGSDVASEVVAGPVCTPNTLHPPLGKERER